MYGYCTFPGWIHVAMLGFKVIKLQYSLKLKIKRNDWLLADMSFKVIKLEYSLKLKTKSND